MKQMQPSKQFQNGQTVWIRSLQEILTTLDADGKLAGLPFMPEMTRYCGHSFRVSCIPTMTCIEGVGFRGLENIVFLENLRCDGSSHDGCQRDCLLFWHEAWLSELPVIPASGLAHDPTVSTPDNILKTQQGQRYFCQSTELAGAASEMRPDESLPHGNLQVLKKLITDLFHNKMTISEFSFRIYDAIMHRLKRLLGMDTSGRIVGQRQKTEAFSLGLQPGEWVEVKTRKEIAETLDVHGKNKGLLFDIPMAEFCGQRFRVESPLNKIILEETGQMVTLKNTVLLQGNVCTAWGCPRANRFFWREIWLKRLE